MNFIVGFSYITVVLYSHSEPSPVARPLPSNKTCFQVYYMLCTVQCLWENNAEVNVSSHTTHPTSASFTETKFLVGKQHVKTIKVRLYSICLHFRTWYRVTFWIVASSYLLQKYLQCNKYFQKQTTTAQDLPVLSSVWGNSLKKLENWNLKRLSNTIVELK